MKKLILISLLAFLTSFLVADATSLQMEIDELRNRLDQQEARINDMGSGSVGSMTLDDLFNFSPGEEGFHRGSSFFLKAGFTDEAFEMDNGWIVGGVLDLKIADVKGMSSLLGEIGISFARSKDDQTINTALLGTFEDAEIRQNTLSIDLGVKYRLDNLGEKGSFLNRFQPYGRVGLAIQVFINNVDDLIGGQVPVAEPLDDRNLPAGQGNFYAGLNFGAGFDFMLSKTMFMGFDWGHYELFIKDGSSDTYTMTLGFRF